MIVCATSYLFVNGALNLVFLKTSECAFCLQSQNPLGCLRLCSLFEVLFVSCVNQHQFNLMIEKCRGRFCLMRLYATSSIVWKWLSESCFPEYFECALCLESQIFLGRLYPWSCSEILLFLMRSSTSSIRKPPKRKEWVITVEEMTHRSVHLDSLW